LDHTAEAARQQGAEVTVSKRAVFWAGKGYALRPWHTVPGEKPALPDVVIFVDADCLVEPGSIDRLARLCVLSRRRSRALI